ncbi:DHA2 family efflux MFS transporter permease subunit [Luedemannella helvata]|uniref:DHA2 family efflux MFS transporter permease subunit n=1 Tax=Luedemannella helvata TaxID=349315 RepID=A0ABP4W834_9ACTN
MSIPQADPDPHTAPTPGESDAPAPTEHIDRRGWLALTCIALGVSLVIMDATIVNVALPVVIKDLGLSAADAQWTNATYSLVFAALLLTVGRLGDLRGRRRLLISGMILFMAASAVAGASTSPLMLIGSRLVQGLGAAMIVPSALSTLNAMFSGRARTIAFAVWGSAIGGMAAIGPLVGGWLATDTSWRWAFWLNIPIGLLIVIGIIRSVPETRDPATTPGGDPVGVALSALGMGAIVFALIEGHWFGWWRQEDGSISPVAPALTAGIVLILVFIGYERRRATLGRPALMDLGLFRLRSFRSGVIAAMIVALGEFGLLFTLPLLLQGSLGYTALGTGAVIVALALGTFLISGMLPQLSKRMSRRAIVQVGLALEALAIGALALTVSTTISTWLICLLLFVYGIGVGMATAQLTALLLSDVPPRESGQASGIQSTIRQLGSALGVAALGGLLINQLTNVTQHNLAALRLPADTIDALTTAVSESAGTAIAGLQASPPGPGIAQAVTNAMISASQTTLWIAAAVLFVGLLFTLRLPKAPTPRG